jgi:hypothetical protein
MIQKKLSWLAMIVMAHNLSVQAVEKNTVASNDYWQTIHLDRYTQTQKNDILNHVDLNIEPLYGTLTHGKGAYTRLFPHHPSCQIIGTDRDWLISRDGFWIKHKTNRIIVNLPTETLPQNSDTKGDIDDRLLGAIQSLGWFLQHNPQCDIHIYHAFLMRHKVKKIDISCIGTHIKSIQTSTWPMEQILAWDPLSVWKVTALNQPATTGFPAKMQVVVMNAHRLGSKGRVLSHDSLYMAYIPHFCYRFYWHEKKNTLVFDVNYPLLLDFTLGGLNILQGKDIDKISFNSDIFVLFPLWFMKSANQREKQNSNFKKLTHVMFTSSCAFVSKDRETCAQGLYLLFHCAQKKRNATKASLDSLPTGVYRTIAEFLGACEYFVNMPQQWIS